MRNISITAVYLIVLFCFSCTKEKIEKDFTVTVKQPYSYPAEVIVTDNKGVFIASFYPQQNPTISSHTFKVDSKISAVQVHLGVKFEGQPTQIFSRLDVRDQETVSFVTNLNSYQGDQIIKKCIRVHGIQVLDSLGIIGGNLYTTKEPNEDFATTCSFIFPNQGIVLHAKANNELSYRYLYLSDTFMVGAPFVTEINYEDFAINPPIKSFYVPSDFDSISFIQVDAVSPDVTRFVNLGLNNNFDLDNLHFICPENAYHNYRIRIEGVSGILDKIFYENEPLVFESPDVSIYDISSTPGTGFKLSSQGDIDFMEVVCAESIYYNWSIQGLPESFREVTLPSLNELKKYIPLDSPFPSPFWRFEVRAHTFGKHSFKDIAEGWPFLSGKYFELPKSGYSMVRVRYE